MAQTLEAVFVHGNDQLRRDHTPGSDLTVGTIINLGSGLTGIVTTPEGITSGSLGSVATGGVFSVKKNDSNGPAFSVGDVVEWDNTNKLATTVGLGTWKIGRCVKAATSSDDHVWVDLNRNVPA